MQCKGCQAEVPDGASFCHKCGAAIVVDDSGDWGDAANVAKETTNEPVPSAPADDRPAARDRLSDMVDSRHNRDDEDEQEIWKGNYSAKAMYFHFSVGIVISIVSAVASFYFASFGRALFIWFSFSAVIAVALLIWLGIRKLSVRYELSSQRLIHKRGILRRVTDRIELIDIDDVTFAQGIVERMLGVGTITVTSSDRTHPKFDMPGIDSVNKIAGEIDDLRRDERRRRGLHIESI